MGKGKRARVDRQEAVDAKIEKKNQLLKEEKKKKRNSAIMAAAMGVIALVIVVAVIFSAVSSTGIFLRSSVAGETENYEVDSAMMSYFINSQYYTFANQMGDYLSYFNLDTSLPLKSQSYSDTQTWFDYFAEQAKTSINELLALAESAKAAGVELEAEDKAKVDEYIDNLAANAKEIGYTKGQYITAMYGAGVKEKDVRRCIELSVLAEKYQAQKIDSFTYDDAAIDAYYNENENTFKYVDVKTYTFTASIPEGATDDEKADILAPTKAKAEALAACNTAEAFDEYLRGELTTEATTDADKEANEETIAATLATGKAYSESDEAMVWAFESGRAVGDTTITEDTNSFTVTMLVKAPYRNEYNTRSMRHILINSSAYASDEEALAAAEAIYDEWKNGAATEDSFAALAKEHSNDSGSSDNGGFYDQMIKGTDDTFDAWLFDSARVAGDNEIVKSTYGYHIMYYIGEGDPAWRAQVRDTLRTNDYNEFLTNAKTTYPVTYNADAINKVEA